VQFLVTNWLKLLIFALIALMVIWAAVRDRKHSEKASRPGMSRAAKVDEGNASLKCNR
jgi:hypothetical protein